MPPCADGHAFDPGSACLRAVAGGSGHVAGDELERSSFDNVDRRSRSAGATADTSVAEEFRYGEFYGLAAEDSSTWVPIEAASVEHPEDTVVLAATGAVGTAPRGTFVVVRPVRGEETVPERVIEVSVTVPS